MTRIKNTNKRPKNEPWWRDCSWRRHACKRDDCPMCGRIKKDRQRHIEKGEDPDDMGVVFDDIGKIFSEVFEKIKEEMKEEGIEHEDIEEIGESVGDESSYEHPLYKEVEK